MREDVLLREGIYMWIAGYHASVEGESVVQAERKVAVAAEDEGGTEV